MANLKQNLQELFTQLNRLESITSKQLYDKLLELFNVEIRKSGRGHVVFVTDGDGNPVRFPIHLSDFSERPKFFVSDKVEKEIQQPKPVIDWFQLGQLVRDLNQFVERSTMTESNKRQHLKRKRKQKRY